MAEKRPIGVDLFAGAGGMTLGFEQAGFDVMAAVEIDPIHCAAHEANFPQWSVLCKSVAETSGTQIRESSGIQDRDIDVVFGGPPCQGFSMIGKRALDDPRNLLMQHFVRITLELRPKHFVMENVSGLAVGNHRRFLVEVMDEFEKHGYAVERQFQVLNAAHFGVPQDRRRVFVFGSRKGLSLPTYPNPTSDSRRKNEKSLNLIAELPPPPSVWDAISDLPEVEKYPELLKRDWIRVASLPQCSDYASELRGDRAAASDFSYLRLHDPHLFTNCLRTEHTPISIKRFQETEPGKVESISRFLKLNPNGVCNTLRAGTPSNRGAFTSPRPIHPNSPRCITVREAARLHSYPDWFHFHVTNWHGFRQIGNSVPPRLANAVARQIMQVIGFKSSKPDSFATSHLLSLNMSEAAARYGVHRHVIEPRLRMAKEIAAG